MKNKKFKFGDIITDSTRSRYQVYGVFGKGYYVCELFENGTKGQPFNIPYQDEELYKIYTEPKERNCNLFCSTCVFGKIRNEKEDEWARWLTTYGDIFCKALDKKTYHMFELNHYARKYLNYDCSARDCAPGDCPFLEHETETFDY